MRTVGRDGRGLWVPFTGTGVDLWPGGTGSKPLRTAALRGGCLVAERRMPGKGQVK